MSLLKSKVAAEVHFSHTFRARPSATQPFSVSKWPWPKEVPTGEYTCGFNAMGLDATYSATPGTPILASNVTKMMKRYFSTPSPPPRPFLVAIKAGEDPVPLAATSRLRSLSPEEIRFAFFLAIARDIDGADNDCLQLWRKVLLSTPITFHVIDNESDMHWLVTGQLNQNEQVVREDSWGGVFLGVA